jgi:hypothetical protein
LGASVDAFVDASVDADDSVGDAGGCTGRFSLSSYEPGGRVRPRNFNLVSWVTQAAFKAGLFNLRR